MQCINCNNILNGYPLVCPYCHTNPASCGSAPYSGTEGLQGDGVYCPEVAAGVTAYIGGLACVVCLPVGLGILGLGAVRYAYDKIKGR